MDLILRNNAFKRNKNREKSIGDIFNNASTSLNSILSFAISVFFTPAIMATSIFSHEIVLILINLSLCLGNLTNFAYRIYQSDIGKTELMLSLLILAGFIAGAYFLFPAIAATSTLLGAVALANQLAVGINLFFLLRNSIVPPILAFFKSIGIKFGFVIQDKFYQIKDLDLEKDDCIVNALMEENFNHSIYEGAVDSDLRKLNTLLQILTNYINKYDETILGEVKYKEAIKGVEGNIKQLTVKGSASSSYTFVKQKIAFKNVKLTRLNHAKKQLEETKNPNWETWSKYCKGVGKTAYDKKPSFFHKQAVDLLNKEINRQKEKVDHLSSCLP